MLQKHQSKMGEMEACSWEKVKVELDLGEWMGLKRENRQGDIAGR